jgi:hypothetical protein
VMKVRTSVQISFGAPTLKSYFEEIDPSICRSLYLSISLDGFRRAPTILLRPPSNPDTHPQAQSGCVRKCWPRERVLAERPGGKGFVCKVCESHHWQAGYSTKGGD